MFKNIEISEINKAFVRSSLWAETVAIIILTYLLTVGFLLIVDQQNVNLDIKEAIIVGAIGVVKFIYANWYYWLIFLVVIWLLERFLITNAATEKRIYFIFSAEWLMSLGIIYLFEKESLPFHSWLMIAGLFALTKALRLIFLKYKNRMLNQVRVSRHQ